MGVHFVSSYYSSMLAAGLKFEREICPDAKCGWLGQSLIQFTTMARYVDYTHIQYFFTIIIAIYEVLKLKIAMNYEQNKILVICWTDLNKCQSGPEQSWTSN